MSRQADEALARSRRKPPLRQGAFAFLGEVQETKEAVELATVDAELIRDVIATWTSMGHAITLGRTSDGGAVAVSLLAGGNRKSLYYSDLALFEDFLTRVRDAQPVS